MALDNVVTDFPQKGDSDDLIVGMGKTAAVRPDLPANDEFLIAFDAPLFEHADDGALPADAEGGRDRRPVGAGPDHGDVGTATDDKAQRIEKN